MCLDGSSTMYCRSRPSELMTRPIAFMVNPASRNSCRRFAALCPVVVYGLPAFAAAYRFRSHTDRFTRQSKHLHLLLNPVRVFTCAVTAHLPPCTSRSDQPSTPGTGRSHHVRTRPCLLHRPVRA